MLKLDASHVVIVRVRVLCDLSPLTLFFFCLLLAYFLFPLCSQSSIFLIYGFFVFILFTSLLDG